MVAAAETVPGPVGYLVLDNLLIWGSLAVLAIQVGRRAGVASMLLLCLVEVGFLTGPGRGSASIDSGSVRKVVATAAAEPGTIFVSIAPAHGGRPELRSVPLFMPTRAAVWTLAIYALLAWSERRSRRGPAHSPLAHAAV